MGTAGGVGVGVTHVFHLQYSGLTIEPEKTADGEEYSSTQERTYPGVLTPPLYGYCLNIGVPLGYRQTRTNRTCVCVCVFI